MYTPFCHLWRHRVSLIANLTRTLMIKCVRIADEDPCCVAVSIECKALPIASWPELTLTSYGLQADELVVLQRAVEASLLQESFQLGTGAATDALNDLVNRIEQLFHPQPHPAAEEISPESNPFSAVFSLLKQLFHWLSGQFASQSPQVDSPVDPTRPWSR